MRVAALWRYPIKSLGGEPLPSATLSADGVVGDRIVHVGGPAGPVTGRTRHRLLALAAITGPDGIPRLAGHRWDTPEAERIIQDCAGEDTHLVSYQGPERFDVLNLLVATDGAVDRFGYDIRRLRPNLLIAGVAADDEATWPGQALATGDALIGVHSLRQRCVVTSIDPDTGERNPEAFRRIKQSFGGWLALNCWVIRPGTLELDAPVHLVPTTAAPAAIGGWIVGAPYIRRQAGQGPPTSR